jgi:hypothetical protein
MGDNPDGVLGCIAHNAPAVIYQQPVQGISLGLLFPRFLPMSNHGSGILAAVAKRKRAKVTGEGRCKGQSLFCVLLEARRRYQTPVRFSVFFGPFLLLLLFSRQPSFFIAGRLPVFLSWARFLFTREAGRRSRRQTGYGEARSGREHRPSSTATLAGGQVVGSRCCSVFCSL